MTDARLLPPNRTPLESALAALSSLALDTTALRSLWSARHCPPEALPWLSWSLSVEGWSDARSDDARRAVILESIRIHRHKGTPWAIRALIRALGFGEVRIVERMGGHTHNGAISRNSEFARQPLSSTWATYRIDFDRPITNPQAARIRALLPAVAPARCHCIGLRFSAVAHSHNGAIRRNGNFNRGTA